MEPNAHGVTQAPDNSLRSQVENLTKLVNTLTEQLAHASPNNVVGSSPATAENFKDRYWFGSLQMVTVINPAWYRENGQGTPVTRDYEFMVEMRHFRVLAGKREEFPGPIANVYLDGMSRIIAQNEEKLSFIGDPNMKKIYYDKLIVDVRDLAPSYDPTPAYLRNVAPTAVGEAPPERPPWDSSIGERASDIAPNAPAPPMSAPEPPQTTPPKPVTKEFDLEGSNYKYMVDKNGQERYFMNGKLTSAAVYAKAASML